MLSATTWYPHTSHQSDRVHDGGKCADMSEDEHEFVMSYHWEEVTSLKTKGTALPCSDLYCIPHRAAVGFSKAVYGEKLISVEGPPSEDGTTSKIEYRVWNPFRSKLAAAVLGGVDAIHILPGAKVSIAYALFVIILSKHRAILAPRFSPDQLHGNGCSYIDFSLVIVS